MRRAPHATLKVAKYSYKHLRRIDIFTNFAPKLKDDNQIAH